MARIPLISDFTYNRNQPTANDYFNNSAAMLIANNGVPIIPQRTIPSASEPISQAILNGSAIPDPGSVSQPSKNISGGGGGISSGPSQAELNGVLDNIRNLDQVLANKNQTAQDLYNQARKSYDDTFALDRQAHDKAVTQNEQANTDARQAAMIQTATGGRGLRSVLASMNAANGTGLDLANQAISREANIDIGNADKNFQTNASNLTDAWARAEDEDKKRRAEADTILANTKTNNAADVASSRQSMYNQLAGMYNRGSSQANNYLAKATALNPEIVAGSKQAVTPYTQSRQLFAPGELQQYLGGVRDLTVGASAAPSGQSSIPINSPLFGQSEDKRRQIGVA